MRRPFASCLAMLGAACAQPQADLGARAPAGWEGFCFPAPIAFLPGTARVSPGTERIMPVFYEMYLRDAQWVHLAVGGGPDARDRTARRLAARRAQAALRLLARMGTRPERVQVSISFDGEVPRLDRDAAFTPPSPSDEAVPMDWAAHAIAMIPPEEVERNRALQRENPRLIFC